MLPHKLQGFFANRVFEKNICKDSSIFPYKNTTPTMAPPYPRGLWFKQTWITTWWCFHTSYGNSGQLLFQKIFLCIFICKIQPSVWPRLTLRIMIWKKLESSLSENASIEVSYFLDEWFLKNTKTFLIIPDYLPLKEAVTLHFNKLEFPSPNDVLYQVWLKFTQWFLKRSWKCTKFTDRQTERLMPTKSLEKRSLELSTQLS